MTRKNTAASFLQWFPAETRVFFIGDCQVRGRVKPGFIKSEHVQLAQRKEAKTEPTAAAAPELNNHNGCRSLVLTLIKPTKIKRRHAFKNDNYACVTRNLEFLNLALKTRKQGNKSVTVTFIKR